MMQTFAPQKVATDLVLDLVLLRPILLVHRRDRKLRQLADTVIQHLLYPPHPRPHLLHLHLRLHLLQAVSKITSEFQFINTYFFLKKIGSDYNIRTSTCITLNQSYTGLERHYVEYVETIDCSTCKG